VIIYQALINVVKIVGSVPLNKGVQKRRHLRFQYFYDSCSTKQNSVQYIVVSEL
jgi:hypothetical protein